MHTHVQRHLWTMWIFRIKCLYLYVNVCTFENTAIEMDLMSSFIWHQLLMCYILAMRGSRKFHEGGPDNVVFFFSNQRITKMTIRTSLEKQLDPNCFSRGVRIRSFKDFITYSYLWFSRSGDPGPLPPSLWIRPCYLLKSVCYSERKIVFTVNCIFSK